MRGHRLPPSLALRHPWLPDLPSPPLPGEGGEGGRERCSTSCRSTDDPAGTGKSASGTACEECSNRSGLAARVFRARGGGSGFSGIFEIVAAAKAGAVG